MVSFYLRPDQHYKLRMLAVEKRTNVSELIREALTARFGEDISEDGVSASRVLSKGKKHARK